MRLGICCGTDNFSLAKNVGFDYAEPPIAPLQNYDKTLLTETKKLVDDIGFSIDGFNNFFPGSISIYNDAFDTIIDCAKRNFEIASMFQSGYLVIGSGRSRSIPSDFSKEKAEYIFSNIVDTIANLGKQCGIRIFIEPLNYNETNYINTLKDGIQFKRSLNNDNVGCLVDLFHFYKNKEDLNDFDLLYPGELTHVHIARPNDDRDAPIKEDYEALKIWADKLKDINYNERISLECLWKKGMENSIREAYEQLTVFK